jgi:hypothetical protein
MKKIIALISVILLLFLSIQQVNSSSLDNQNTLNLPNIHLIEGIEYIAQTEGYFCYYSCFTMIFNYMGLNTSLNEVLFYDGLGYTHYYNKNERLPDDGCYSDPQFIFNLFGVEEEWIYLESDESTSASWEEFYIKIKEKISNNIPIITRVDPFSMPSLRGQFKISDKLWKILFPPNHHLVLIVGYNDTNQTICYMDPNAGFYGKNHYGDYAWMSLDEYRYATEKNIWSRFIISSYNINNTVYSPKERFEKALNNNIERLKGSYSYFSWLLGIKASKEMKKHFSMDDKDETIKLYKQYTGNGLEFTFNYYMQKLLSTLYPYKPNIFDIFMVGKEDPFESIAEEKQHAIDYLESSNHYPDICKNHSILLKQESELWFHLSNYYKVFLKRGKYLSSLRANFLIKKMEETMNQIILIEEKLIEDFIPF